MDDVCAWCGKKAQEAKISLSVLTARDMSLTIKRKKERS